MITVTGKLIISLFHVGKNKAYEMIKTAREELNKPKKATLTLKEFCKANAHDYDSVITEAQRITGKK